MRIAKWIVLALLLVTAGCGESVEHKLQQAKIALNSGRPDAALTYAKGALEERPGDPTALLLSAKAHLRLRHYDDSRTILLELTKVDVVALESRLELLNLALSEMVDLLNASEFTTSKVLDQKFTDAKTLGHAQADWLSTTDKQLATAEYARARLVLIDSQRIGRLLKEEEARIRGEQGLIDPNLPVSNAAVEEMRRQIKSMLLTAERHADATLMADPGHFQAGSMLIRLLHQREAWSDIWVFASTIQKRKDLPPTLAAELVGEVLNISDRLYPIETRLETCRSLMEAVSEQGRNSVAWKNVRARLYLREGEKDKAMALAQEVFRLQPNEVEHRLTYAWCLFEAKQYSQAKTILQNLAADNRQHEHVQLIYGLALAQLSENTLAVEHLRRVLDLNSSNLIARNALVKILSENRDAVTSVMDDINKLYQANPADVEAIQYKFIAEVASNNTDNVKALLGAIEKLSPRKVGHLRTLIDGFIYLRDLNTALQYAKDAVQLAPTVQDNHLNLARVYLMKQDMESARRTLVESLDAFPDHFSINEALAQIYLNQGDYDRAIELAKGLIKERPGHINSYLMLAHAYGQLSLAEEALEQLNIVLDLHPNEPRALEMAASIHRMTGQHDMAKLYIEKIDESKIDESKYPAVLAQLKLQKGDWKEALAICNRAIAIGSTDPRVRLTLAAIHGKDKNTGEEEIHLMAFVREHPENFLGYQMLARFYMANNIERGIAQFRSLRLSNETLSRLGEAHLLISIGRYADAIDTMSETYVRLLKNRDLTAWSYARLLAACFIRRDRNQINALAVFDGLIAAKMNVPLAMLTQLDIVWELIDLDTKLGTLKRVEPTLEAQDIAMIVATSNRYIKANRADLGLALLDQWVAQLPDQESLHRARGETLTQMGQMDAAVEAFKKAMELAPDLASNHERVAFALIRAGDFPAAEQSFDRTAQIDIGARISATWGKGNLYLQLGLNEQAVAAFQELDSIGRRNDPRVLLVMGRGLLALGRTDEAKRVLLLVPAYSTHYPVAQILLARMEMNAEMHEAAKTRLDQLARDPEVVSAAVRELVNLNVKQGNDAQLIEWSDAVLKLDGLPMARRSQWLTIRSVIQSRKRDWEGLERTLEKAHEVSTNPQAVMAARITLLIYLNKVEHAKTLLKEDKILRVSAGGGMLAMLMGVPSESTSPLSPLAQLLDAMERKDTDAATLWASRIPASNTTRYPSDYVAWVKTQSQASGGGEPLVRRLALASIARDTGLSALAADISAKLVEESPTFSPAHGMLIQALEDQQASLDAAQAAALAAVPDSSLALFIQAIHKSRKADWQGAIAACNEVLKREPNHEWVHYHLAGLYNKAGQFDSSIEALEQLRTYATTLRPATTNDLAYRIALHQKPRLDIAQVLAKELVAQYPKAAPYADTLAWIEYLRGENQAALGHMVRAITDLSAVPEAHYHLGVLYQAKGNKTWAQYHLAVAAKETQSEFGQDAARRLQELARQ